MYQEKKLFRSPSPRLSTMGRATNKKYVATVAAQQESAAAADRNGLPWQVCILSPVSCGTELTCPFMAPAV